MGILLPPVLPPNLYRYRSLAPKLGDNTSPKDVLRREIAAIQTPYIWCSEFKNLNDPMEGFYRPSNLLKNDKEYERIARSIATSKSCVGIASLSDTKENELMWTHYAGNYSGICIEYYSQRLLDALPKDASMVRMGYGDLPPRIIKADADQQTAERKILSQKKIQLGV